MKNLMKVSLVAVAMIFTLSSCNCYKKMMKETQAGITVTCSPEIVTLKGDNAIATITVNIPAKTFHKWGVAKLTPVIMWDGGQAAGTPVFLQGEKVQDNYKVIPYKAGGSVTIDVNIPYQPAMRLSKLVIKAEGKCLKRGKKIKEFTAYPKPIFVANAVSSLQLMADNYAQVAIAPDALKRVTEVNQEAKIMFQINKADVRKDQLNSDEISALEKFIIDNTGDVKKKVGDVYTQAYASPDGPLDLNDKLSNKRGETTHKALGEKFKKDKVPASAKFDINAMGEDWAGFKELVSKSDIADKELILQVLSMYSDPQVRDREIKNMTAAFQVLAEKILPELRRSKMNVNVQIEGLTDDELKAAVAADINTLKLEEMLFAATLFNDNATKAKCYKAAADKFNCYRAWNNLGCVKAWEGDYAGAKEAFLKASSINNSAAQVVNNLGVVALAEGKKAEAAKFFAASNTPEAKYNKGLVELANGNYSAAAASLNGYNKGLAQLLNGDLAAAKSTLASAKGWRADYVKAVIAAREGDANGLISNLKAAINGSSACGCAKKLAATEVNFVNFFEHAEFVAIVLK
ncbi:MAG: hypothetical protein RR551_05260 [Mucinivorans sp.]